GGGRARADRGRLLPGQALLPRARRADGRRARDPLAGAPAGGPRGARRGGGRLVGVPRAGPHGAGRMGDAGDARAPVSRSRAAAFAGRAAGAGGRSLGNGAARARGDRRRRPHASRPPPPAFVPAQRREEAPSPGATWSPRSLAALGRGSNRLVETDDGDPLPPPPPLGDNQLFARLPLRLTSHGERVLRGEADRVELLGIDRWIGGTHVTPGDDWRWEPTAGGARQTRPRPAG